jgi:alkylhydroperoxidase family enzyme
VPSCSRTNGIILVRDLVAHDRDPHPEVTGVAAVLATLITDGHVPDAVYEEARHVFDEKEVGQLIWAAAVINTWNRVAISARSVPGSYEPGQH